MAKVWQEFYCRKSGGGCGGYFMVKLNIALDHKVDVVCPKCKHKHCRSIKNGRILERSAGDGEAKEELCPTIASFSMEPQTVAFQKGDKEQERSAIVTSSADLDAKATKREMWCERFGGGTDSAQE